MPAVLNVLDVAETRVEEITHIAVARGPGGFSAVRVGIATAQGLVEPMGLPLIGVPTHLMQAFAHASSVGERVVSLIPIGRNQVSYGVFKLPMSGVDDEFETGICDLDEVADRFSNDETILCGEASTLISSLETETPVDLIRPPQLLLEIARLAIESGDLSTAPTTPVYARPPTITKSRRF